MKGFITIATCKNKLNEKNYYQLAYNLKKSYEFVTNNNLPFAIITDEINEYTKVFDNIILINKPNYSYLDKIELLKNCIYDEMIFVDSDSLFFNNPNIYFDYFNNCTDFSCFGHVYPIDSDKGWFRKEGSAMFQNDIKYVVDLHGGLYYFKKNQILFDKLYETCKYIIDNYNDFTFKAFQNNPADEPILALSMAVNNCKPIKANEEMILFYPVSKRNVYKVDINKNQLSKRYNGKVHENIVLLHYGTVNTSKFIYQYQVKKLHYFNNRTKLIEYYVFFKLKDYYYLINKIIKKIMR